MFTVYVLYSESARRHYVGQTSNVEGRLKRHNGGGVPFTAKHGPWRIVHTESFDTRSDALRREQEKKSYKGGILFKKLLGFRGSSF